MNKLFSSIKYALDNDFNFVVAQDEVCRIAPQKHVYAVGCQSIAAKLSGLKMKGNIKLIRLIVRHGVSSCWENTRTSYASWAIHRRNRSHIRSRQYVLRFSNSQKVVVQ